MGWGIGPYSIRFTYMIKVSKVILSSSSSERRRGARNVRKSLREKKLLRPETSTQHTISFFGVLEQNKINKFSKRSVNFSIGKKNWIELSSQCFTFVSSVVLSFTGVVARVPELNAR